MASLVLYSTAFCEEKILMGENDQPQRASSWVGRNKNELVKSWGAPDEIFYGQGDVELLIYKKGRQVSVTIHDPFDSLSRRPIAHVLRDDLEFIAEKNGGIVQYNWRTKDQNSTVKSVGRLLAGAVGLGLGIVLVAALAFAIAY